jgi:hypothetical protein
MICSKHALVLIILNFPRETALLKTFGSIPYKSRSTTLTNGNTKYERPLPNAVIKHFLTQIPQLRACHTAPLVVPSLWIWCWAPRRNPLSFFGSKSSLRRSGTARGLTLHYAPLALNTTQKSRFESVDRFERTKTDFVDLVGRAAGIIS